MSGCTLKTGRSFEQTHRRRLVSGLLVVVSLLSAAPVMAAYLSMPETLTLEAGEHLLQTLPPVDSQGQRIQIALGEAPPGVLLTVDDFGQMLLHWQTGPGLADESRIEILLSNIDTGKLLERRQIMIHRVEPEVVPSAPVKPERAIAAASDAVPHLNELPNQLISPGFVVSLQVKATLPDASMPVLQVDRLPKEASFEASEGGSRTFYWHTDDKDEGEHVFRFTAINPVDASLRVSHEVMIVVGDPTKSRTRPKPEG